MVPIYKPTYYIISCKNAQKVTRNNKYLTFFNFLIGFTVSDDVQTRLI